MVVSRYFKKLAMLFVLALVLSSCAGTSKYMVKSDPVVKPVEGKAMVYFFRPSGFGYAINFQIWDGDKFIGLSQAKSYFQYLAEPGKHLFLAIAENKAFIEADLVAGKIYYVLTTPQMGAWRARVGFEPIKNGSEHWLSIPEWKSGLNNLVTVEAEVRNWDELHRDEAKRLVQYFEDTYKKTGKYSEIKSEDGE